MSLPPDNQQKNPLVSVKFVSAILGPEWLRQFYGRLEKCVRSAGKSHVHKIPRFGGGYFGFGGGLPILFYGREDFSEESKFIEVLP